MDIKEIYGTSDTARLGDLRCMAALDGAEASPVYIYRDSYLDGMNDYPLGSVHRCDDGHLTLYAVEGNSRPPMLLGEFLSLPEVRDCFDDTELARFDEVSWNAAQETFFGNCVYGMSEYGENVVRLR